MVDQQSGEKSPKRRIKKEGIVYKHRLSSGRLVALNEKEIELLYLLSKFNILPLHQIQYFSKARDIKLGTLKSTLSRWKDKKIVDSAKIDKLRVFYYLKNEGISILKNLGLINQDVVIEKPSSISFVDHFYGIRDCVLLTLSNFEIKETKELELISPMTQPYTLKAEPDVPYLVPDWIIRYPTGTINFEIDNGTENNQQFTNKIDKYITYAKEHPDVQHKVVIAVIDGTEPDLSYFNLKYENRSGRISNLKQLIMSSSAQQLSNLHFYVVPIGRSGNIAARLIKGIYLNEKYTSLTTQLLDSFIKEKGMPLAYIRLNANDFYLAEVKKELFADEHIALMNKGKKYYCLFKVMEEGSVSNLEQIRYLNLLMKEKRFRYHVDRIIGLYRTGDEIESDVLTGEVLEHTHMISADSWNDNPTQPKAFKNIGANSKSKVKEVILFDE